ncbi:MAG: hypothetical protein MJ252_02355 [archaeon]|nr:hypothetical protein [archaeon]
MNSSKAKLLKDLLESMLGNNLTALEKKISSDMKEINTMKNQMKEDQNIIDIANKNIKPEPIKKTKSIKVESSKKISKSKEALKTTPYSTNVQKTIEPKESFIKTKAKNKIKSKLGMTIEEAVPHKSSLINRPLTPIPASKHIAYRNLKNKKSINNTITLNSKKEKDKKDGTPVKHVTFGAKKVNFTTLPSKEITMEKKNSNTNLSVFTSSTNTLSGAVKGQRTPVTIKTKSKYSQMGFNISRVIGDVSNLDDELLTSISTDCIIKNTYGQLKKFNFKDIFLDKLNFIHFLSIEEYLTFISMNKEIGRFAIKEFISHLDKLILKAEKESESSINSKEILKAKTIKVMDLLNEEGYMNIFVSRRNLNMSFGGTFNPNGNPLNNEGKETSIVDDDVYEIFKIFIQFFPKSKKAVKDIIALSHSKKVFWIKLSEFILNNSKERFGDYLKEEYFNFDYSKQNLIKIETMLINNFGLFSFKSSKLSKKCPTTGLIILFLKDILNNLKILPKAQKAVYTKIRDKYKKLQSGIFT